MWPRVTRGRRAVVLLADAFFDLTAQLLCGVAALMKPSRGENKRGNVQFGSHSTSARSWELGEVSQSLYT